MLWAWSSAALLTATTATAATVLAFGAAQPDSASTVTLGTAVPAEYTSAILSASEQCPAVSPPVLASQLELASGWDPRARTGLAGLSPQEWQAWSRDGDDDGTADPASADDSIASLGALMCSLLEAATDAPGDRLTTALTARVDGIEDLRANDWHPSRRAADYAAEVLRLARRPDHAVTTADGGEVSIADLPQGYHNPRTPGQAVAWALSQVGVVRDNGYCLRFVDLAYGRGSGPASAYMVWSHSPAWMHHPGDFRPPRGALVIWSPAIGGGHGHIAISLGDGTMVTTTRGAVAITSIAGFSDSAYWGWMPPYFYM